MKRVGVLAGLLMALAMTSASAQSPQRPPALALHYGFWAPNYALAQHRVLDAALAAVQPRTVGKRNVYVLSAALYGQHVFENEAVGAASLLESHFNAVGHSIVLSNYHPNATPRYPAASITNIETALGRLGEVMDRDNDLAVIFFTSHGNRGAGISGYESVVGAESQPLVDYAILPGRLRGALDAAGIRNRIIILSACFAGQFIPTLQDANTIVLTAASAERTSFGCQAEADWTYFGDAMFNGALPQSSSLLGAFDKAKAIISALETQQKLTPSLPQSSIGEAAAKVLAEIEKKK